MSTAVLLHGNLGGLNHGPLLPLVVVNDGLTRDTWTDKKRRHKQDWVVVVEEADPHDVPLSRVWYPL